MGTFKPVDYFSWMTELDGDNWDNYPSSNDPMSLSALRYDLMRGYDKITHGRVYFEIPALLQQLGM